MKLHNFVLLVYTLIFLAGWTTIFYLPNRDESKSQSSALVIMRCDVMNEFTGDIKLRYTLRPINKGCNQ